MPNSDFDYITNYYSILGKQAFISKSLLSVIPVAFCKRNTVVVSDNRILRGVAKIRRIERTTALKAEEDAIQFFAMQDCLKLLAKKNVPVYFYNRIGKEKDGFQYTDKEKVRMEKGLSFPKMYENIEIYENDLKDVFGDLYSKEYVREIGKIPQVIMVNNIYQHEDYHSQYINVENGKRITISQPPAFSKTIHVYGRCGAFGYAVEDKDTIPSRLQKELLENGISDIRVINHGLWGGGDQFLDHNFLQEAMGFKKGDIVLFYRKHIDKKLLSQFEKYGLRYKEITHEWHKQKDEKVTFFDRPGHMNADGYKLTAKLICDDLITTEFSCGGISHNLDTTSAEHLNYYLKTRTNKDFDKEIGEYTAQINSDFPLAADMQNNGAIVMNCNPFTYGHRYLIEKAAAQVDRLYIFVVEEDKSFFKYKDRFEMVKKGTEDLDNIVVVPSGKFIISAYTFPEYFMKDYVKEKNFDVSMDVETFCKYIAPPLNIRKRFAGEEPFDPVTKNYNENMGRILPQYNMEFVEIPRYALDSERVVNATRVRELLSRKSFDELKEYVPDSTYQVLMKNYC